MSSYNLVNDKVHVLVVRYGGTEFVANVYQSFTAAQLCGDSYVNEGIYDSYYIASKRLL